jgi:AraC family transcriptional regulator, ethanolamine operon transcriptional activator
MTGTATTANRYSCLARSADDAAVHSQSATDWAHQYEQVAASRFHGMHAEAWLGPLQICYERVEGAFRYRGRPWEGARVFLSFLPGTGEVLYDGRPVANGTLLTHRWDTVGRVTCNRQAEVLVAAIDESFLERYAQRAAHRSFFEHDDGTPLICAQDENPVAGFERSVKGALETISKNPLLLHNEQARLSLQQAVVGALCDALLAGSPDENRLPSASTRAYIVEKAIQFIESRLADPLSVGDISAAVRVCPRTLRYSFEQVLGVTPTQYVRAQRLNRVRRDLVAGRNDSIQSAAARWGFWHMGRFASYYRQTFGEHPSRTLQVQPRSRATPTSPAAPSRDEAFGLPLSFYQVAGQRVAC